MLPIVRRLTPGIIVFFNLPNLSNLSQFHPYIAFEVKNQNEVIIDYIIIDENETLLTIPSFQ